MFGKFPPDGPSYIPPWRKFYNFIKKKSRENPRCVFGVRFTLRNVLKLTFSTRLRSDVQYRQLVYFDVAIMSKYRQEISNKSVKSAAFFIVSTNLTFTIGRN